jgi:hypothetical protein
MKERRSHPFRYCLAVAKLVRIVRRYFNAGLQSSEVRFLLPHTVMCFVKGKGKVVPVLNQLSITPWRFYIRSIWIVYLHIIYHYSNCIKIVYDRYLLNIRKRFWILVILTDFKSTLRKVISVLFVYPINRFTNFVALLYCWNTKLDRSSN